MKKRFVSKKKLNVNIFKIIIFLLIVYFSFVITFKILFKVNLENKIDNNRFINYLLSSSTNNLTNSTSLKDIINTDIASPSTLFRFSMNNLVKGISNDYVISEVDEEESSVNTEYIADPNPVKIEKPVVYIYNTHQRENYSMASLEPYNIKPNVLMASYILREKLNDLGIPTIVETNDITEILRINNWKYAASYNASKMLIEDAKKKNPTLKFFIDIHRDSSAYDKTVTEIDGKKYARILMIVGKEHDAYEKNLKVTNKIAELIKAEDQSLFRSVYVKEGPGVNGIYNQDLGENLILVEMGGQYNTIEEVNNTIPILAKVVYKYMKENVL